MVPAEGARCFYGNREINTRSEVQRGCLIKYLSVVTISTLWDGVEAVSRRCVRASRLLLS